MLRSIKDDRVQLEKLYHYMLNEFRQEEGGESIIVPERYKALVKDTADSLNASLVCYINPATLEKIEIPQSALGTMIFDFDDEEDVMEDDEPFYEDMKRIHRDWEHTITITPPKSRISFSFMEQFVNSLL